MSHTPVQNGRSVITPSGDNPYGVTITLTDINATFYNVEDGTPPGGLPPRLNQYYDPSQGKMMDGNNAQIHWLSTFQLTKKPGASGNARYNIQLSDKTSSFYVWYDEANSRMVLLGQTNQGRGPVNSLFTQDDPSVGMT